LPFKIKKKKSDGRLVVANTELTFKMTKKENRAAELVVANTKLVFKYRKEKQTAN
jgi:hypothetical protein